MPLASIADVIQDLRQGRMVILVDEEDRENEGDLVFAAELVTPEIINFMATHARGLICLTLTDTQCERLRLLPMVQDNRAQHGTNFTVSIEAASGVSTGISAHDRAHTIRTAVQPQARAEDLVQPGHVFPLRAARGGVLMRAGHTEAGCDLAQLAGLQPAAVICEIMREDGAMARLPDLERFAARHGLRIASIADLIAYRSRTESLIRRVGRQPLHTAAGAFDCHLFRDVPANGLHLALVCGEVNAQGQLEQSAHSAPTLVRVHEPLSLVDLLEQRGTTHSWGLAQSLSEIARAGGVLVLLNAGESADQLAERIDNVVKPAEAQGSAASASDLRSYGVGAQILRELGVRRMRLLGHPRRMPSMAGYGLEIVDFVERPQDHHQHTSPSTASA